MMCVCVSRWACVHILFNMEFYCMYMCSSLVNSCLTHLQSAIAEHAVNLQRYLTTLMVSGLTTKQSLLPRAPYCLCCMLAAVQ